MQEELEKQSDELLSPYPGIYTEEDLINRMRRENAVPLDPDRVDAAIVATSRRREITLARLMIMARCTARQREIVRTCVRLRLAGHVTQSEMAEMIGISQPALSRILGRAYERIECALESIDAEPTGPYINAEQLFNLELMHKRRQIYRRRITRFKRGLRGRKLCHEKPRSKCNSSSVDDMINR